jgi:hypothetical protein
VLPLILKAMASPTPAAAPAATAASTDAAAKRLQEQLQGTDAATKLAALSVFRRLLEASLEAVSHQVGGWVGVCLCVW